MDSTPYCDSWNEFHSPNSKTSCLAIPRVLYSERNAPSPSRSHRPPTAEERPQKAPASTIATRTRNRLQQTPTPTPRRDPREVFSDRNLWGPRQNPGVPMAWESNSRGSSTKSIGLCLHSRHQRADQTKAARSESVGGTGVKSCDLLTLQVPREAFGSSMAQKSVKVH